MGNYLSITGDTAGVVVSGAGVTGQCFQDYFWLAPACRQQASSCFLWFTGGTGWGMYEMLVKATSYNMPLATAVASNFSNYGKLPLAYDMMLYWWVPDPTFLRPWLLKLDWLLIVVPFAKNQLWQWWLNRKTSRGNAGALGSAIKCTTKAWKGSCMS